jgi:flagellar basal body-associated protein FliL
MEQEQMPNTAPEPGKAPDSKNFLIAIIIILGVALIALGFLFLRNAKEKNPAETESAKTDMQSSAVTSNGNTSAAVNESTPATDTAVAPSTEVKKADLYVKSYTKFKKI